MKKILLTFLFFVSFYPALTHAVVLNDSRLTMPDYTQFQHSSTDYDSYFELIYGNQVVFTSEFNQTAVYNLNLEPYYSSFWQEWTEYEYPHLFQANVYQYLDSYCTQSGGYDNQQECENNEGTWIQGDATLVSNRFFRPGCTDNTASNYGGINVNADDGSCYWSGCTDPQALNFDSEATQNDGSCYYYAVYNGTATSTATSSIPVTVVRDYDLNFGQAIQVFFDALIALGLLFPLRANKRDNA